MPTFEDDKQIGFEQSGKLNFKEEEIKRRK